MTDEDKKTKLIEDKPDEVKAGEIKEEPKKAEPKDEAKSPSTGSHSSLSDEAVRPQSRTAGSDENVEVPTKFKNLVEEIAKMSVLDLSELVKLLEDKFGVSSAAPVMTMAANAADSEVAEEEKSEFNVELTAVGDNKISVIKAIREITQVGLKEAKDMADGAPTMVKEGVKKEEAEAMKKKLEEAGAQVALK